MIAMPLFCACQTVSTPWPDHLDLDYKQTIDLPPFAPSRLSGIGFAKESDATYIAPPARRVTLVFEAYP